MAHTIMAKLFMLCLAFGFAVYYPQHLKAGGNMNNSTINMQDVFFEWLRCCYSPEAMIAGGSVGVPSEAPKGIHIDEYITAIKKALGNTTDKKVVTLAEKKKVSGVPLPYLYIDKNELYVIMIRDYTMAAEIAKELGMPPEDYTPSVLTGKLLPNSKGGWTLLLFTTSTEASGWEYGYAYFYDVFVTVHDGKLRYNIIKVENSNDGTNPLMDEYSRHDFQKNLEEPAVKEYFYVIYSIDIKSGKLFLESADEDFPGLALAFEWNGQRYVKKGLVHKKP